MVGPLVLVGLPVWLLFTPWWWLGVGLITAYLYLSFDGSERRLGKPWRWFHDHAVFRYLFDYFPCSVVKTAELDPSNVYVLAVHPHGTLALNRAIFCFNKQDRWNKQFPGIETRDLVASSAFKIPFIRDLWLWTSCVDASKPVAANVLRHHLSVLVYPGGEAEQIRTEYGKENIHLKSRKGFVRLAMEEGAHLVPIYVFGETSLYKTYSWGMRWRMWVSKRFRVAVVLFMGRFLAAPYAVPLTAVVGEPIIPVTKTDNPSAEAVDALHERYVAALSALFEKHKAAHGYADRTLHID